MVREKSRSRDTELQLPHARLRRRPYRNLGRHTKGMSLRAEDRPLFSDLIESNDATKAQFS